MSKRRSVRTQPLKAEDKEERMEALFQEAKRLRERGTKA